MSKRYPGHRLGEERQHMVSNGVDRQRALRADPRPKAVQGSSIEQLSALRPSLPSTRSYYVLVSRKVKADSSCVLNGFRDGSGLSRVCMHAKRVTIQHY